MDGPFIFSNLKIYVKIVDFVKIIVEKFRYMMKTILLIDDF